MTSVPKRLNRVRAELPSWIADSLLGTLCITRGFPGAAPCNCPIAAAQLVAIPHAVATNLWAGPRLYRIRDSTRDILTLLAWRWAVMGAQKRPVVRNGQARVAGTLSRVHRRRVTQIVLVFYCYSQVRAGSERNAVHTAAARPVVVRAQPATGQSWNRVHAEGV